MTAELSPDDLAEIRRRHHEADFGKGEAVRLDGLPVCVCGEDAPCDAVRLLDEVERLRGEMPIPWSANIPAQIARTEQLKK